MKNLLIHRASVRGIICSEGVEPSATLEIHVKGKPTHSDFAVQACIIEGTVVAISVTAFERIETNNMVVTSSCLYFDIFSRAKGKEKRKERKEKGEKRDGEMGPQHRGVTNV